MLMLRYVDCGCCCVMLFHEGAGAGADLELESAGGEFAAGKESVRREGEGGGR